MKKILVPVDGSKNSDRALLEAKDYAECTGGELTILTVVEQMGRIAGYGPIYVEDEVKDRANPVLNDALNLLSGFKGKIESKLKKGSPAEQIIKEVEEGEYDLVIMGSRGLDNFSRTILGSVSNKILKHTDINVFIIK